MEPNEKKADVNRGSLHFSFNLFFFFFNGEQIGNVVKKEKRKSLQKCDFIHIKGYSEINQEFLQEN